MLQGRRLAASGCRVTWRALASASPASSPSSAISSSTPAAASPPTLPASVPSAPDLTADVSEVMRFAKLADQWWAPRGPYLGLHQLNHVRVPIIVQAAVGVRDGPSAGALVRAGSPSNVGPLAGVRLADIGSGGGILSEALGRLGGTVVGVDACLESVEAARAHLSKSAGVKDRVTYRCVPVEDLAASEAGTFDVVVASEVVEHVASLPRFLASCVALVKPGGSLVITTINKSPLAGALAIFAAEQVLGLVAPGTHEYSKLVGPEELGTTLRAADPSLAIHPVQALWYDPLTGRWSAPASWPSWALVNYALVATKPRPQPLFKDAHVAL